MKNQKQLLLSVHKTTGQLSGLLLLSAMTFACSNPSENGEKPKQNAPSVDAPVESPQVAQIDSHTNHAPQNQNINVPAIQSDAVTPPIEYYLQSYQQQIAKLNDFLVAQSRSDAAPTNDQPAIIWLNFSGGIIKKGMGIDESFIACKDSVDFPATDILDQEKITIVSDVQSYFDAVNTNVSVTKDRPLTRPYTTIHIGGEYADLGCKKNDTILGIAPYDRGNLRQEDVGFVFTKIAKGIAQDLLHVIATTAAHEAGHTYGLAHVDNNRDIMTPSFQSITDGFIGGPVKLLFFSYLQDSPSLLRKNVGSLDNNNPDLLERNCTRLELIKAFLKLNFSRNVNLPEQCKK